jgi:hypothetical protein
MGIIDIWGVVNNINGWPKLTGFFLSDHQGKFSTEDLFIIVIGFMLIFLVFGL